MDSVNVDLEKRDLTEFYNSTAQRSSLSTATSSLLGKFNPLGSSGAERGSDFNGRGSLDDSSDTRAMSMFKVAEGPEDIAQRGRRRQAPKNCVEKILQKLPEESDKPRAIIFFGLSALFSLLAFANLLTIIISPASFTMFFTLAVIFGMVALAVWTGPRQYVETCLEKRYRVRSGALVLSILGAFYFSILSPNWLLSLLSCIIEFNAVLLYFFNTFPMRDGAQKGMQSV